MTFFTILKRPSAFLPMAMSAAAVLTVLVHLVSVGAARQVDEGAAAHVWQLLMLAQVPIVAFFAIRWLPESRRQALVVLGLQAVAVLAALAPVFLLKW